MSPAEFRNEGRTMNFNAHITYSVTSHVMLPVEAETKKEAEIIARRIFTAIILGNLEDRNVFPPETRVTGSVPEIENMEVIKPVSARAKAKRTGP
jgi:hypothetical protein